MKHTIKFALVCLASVAAYLVYSFAALILPTPVAVAAAGSLVTTYVGLAFADIPASRQRTAQGVAIVAMGIESLYGVLWCLALQYPAFFSTPPLWVSIPVAFLHGGSFSVLCFFVSLLVVHEKSDSTDSTDNTALHSIASTLNALAMHQHSTVQALNVLTAPQQAPMQALPMHEVAPTLHEVAPPVAYARMDHTPSMQHSPACAACGALPSPRQQGPIAQGKGWTCKQCGSKNAPHGTEVQA